MELQLQKYFPEINKRQIQQFVKLSQIFPEWNAKVNMVSRKDIDKLFIRHILHSLAIAKCFSFEKGTNLIDVGTGGGFPGIPLAIMFPEANFDLVDRIGKKIKVVQVIADEIGLKNIKTIQSKAELLPAKYDYVISRAVINFPDFMEIAKNLFHKKKTKYQKGIIYLKGGDFVEEIAGIKKIQLFDISDIFDDDFFQTKKIIFLPKK